MQYITYNIKVRLESEKEASYTSDYFYKILKSKSDLHYDVLRLTDSDYYHRPFNTSSFKFKYIGPQCNFEDFYGRTVELTLKLQPYAINKDLKRICGITIKVNKISNI